MTARNISGWRVLRVPSRSVTSGCALKRVRGEFDIDVAWRKFDCAFVGRWLVTRSKRIRVMYVVPDLRIGGAERHVTKLMPNLDPTRFETAVVCIGKEGELFGDLTGSGTRAVALHRT